MGQLFIPEPVYVQRPMLPFERLLHELVGVLQDSSKTESRPSDACCRRQCDATRTGRSRCAPAARHPGIKPMFYTTVAVGNYRPSEVTAKVENGSVVIDARREQRNGDDFDIMETRRVVKLPAAIDESKVVCFLRPDGRVLIQAPPVTRDREDVKETKMEKPTATGPESDDAKSKIRADTSDVVHTPDVTNGATDQKQRESPVNKSDTSDEFTTISIIHETSASPDDTMTSCDAEPEKKETNETQIVERDGVDKLLSDVGTDVDVPLTELDCQEPARHDGNDVIGDVTDTKRPPSPTPSDDFSIIGEPSLSGDADFNPDMEVKDAKNADDHHTEDDSATTSAQLEPLAESVRIVEDGKQKKFELSINLKDFDTDNMSVRFVDNDLFIDATKESSDDGVYSLEEVHRKYAVPEEGVLDAARAQVTSDGMVIVTVPLYREQKAQEMTVPIVQLEE